MSNSEANVQKPFMNITDAAARLGIHPNTLRAACRRNEFPHLRIGRTVRISTAKLAEIEAGGAN
jgi:excisionase family DNA binding protein